MTNEQVALDATDVTLPIGAEFEADGVFYRFTVWELPEHERVLGMGRYRLTVLTSGESPRSFTTGGVSFADAGSAVAELHAILRLRAKAEGQGEP